MHLFFILVFVLLFLPPARVTTSTAKTIMAVFAHPDDESFMSPLLARYAREGHKVYLVLATSGEKGVRNYTGIPAGDSLAAKRESEAACVCRRLGMEPPVFLRLKDGELDVDFTGAPLRKKIDSVFRRYKPDIVITWGPDGGYGHTDHRMVHNVVTELYQSGMNAHPEKLFYSALSSENWQQKPELKTGLAGFFHRDWKTVKNEFLTVRIPCTAADRKKAMEAMRCHWSQFTKEEMDDLETWLTAMNRNDTVYLRPFAPQTKMSYSLMD